MNYFQMKPKIEDSILNVVKSQRQDLKELG